MDHKSVQWAGSQVSDEELGLCPKGTEEPWRVCE